MAEIRSEDLQIGAYELRQSMDYVVVVHHVPSGLTVASASEKSQLQNKAKALAELHALLDAAPGPAPDRAAAEVAPQPAEASDYMAAYHDFWAELVETDGRLDLDKLARELFDFRTLMDSASSVYSELANLSKPLTAPHVVIGEANRRIEEIVEDAVREETSELLAELDRQRALIAAVLASARFHRSLTYYEIRALLEGEKR